MAPAVPRPLDLQLNGYAGIDFAAADLASHHMREAAAALERDGGGQALATLITDDLAILEERIARLAAVIHADASVRAIFPGIHVEGPFIRAEPGYVGAHPPRYAIPADVAAAKRLVSAGRGLVRMMTLAPERDPGMATTRALADQGILVAAGHCDPSRDELAAAVRAGLGAFTHLGNGCPHVLPRHDNVIQRVLGCRGLRWITFIADGVHVPPFALANYLRAAGLDRAIAVTDATAAAGMGPGRFRLGSREVVVGADGAAWSEDRTHLVGSTASMGRVRLVLATEVDLSTAEVDRLTVENPALALGPA
ncbi:MAG: N-acetylglucosamine-6-phosphate deacetylase [Planctomycetaceae bacterium]